jgi:hypothetical protein
MDWKNQLWIGYPLEGKHSTTAVLHRTTFRFLGTSWMVRFLAHWRCVTGMVIKVGYPGVAARDAKQKAQFTTKI